MDKFNHVLKYVWLAGGILCLIVFIYQATPILLNALGTGVQQTLGVFLIFFGLALLTAWAVFFFTKQFVMLKDRQHFYRIRQRQREMNMQK